MNAGRPAISVVIASQNSPGTLRECLESLRRQDPAGAAEVIVAGDSRDGSGQMVQRQFPRVRHLQMPRPALVPELWASGAAAATGSIIAFTTGECVPDDQWLAHIQATLGRGDVAGAGGVIVNRRPSSLTRWAIYLMRYAAYAPPLGTREARQIPGDNAAYRRWVFQSYASHLRAGFWENVVNDRLVQDGHRLVLTPDIAVEYADAPTARAFCRQRYLHGRRFGVDRLAAGRARWRGVVSAPLIPVIYLFRIARAVMVRKGLRGALLGSFPLVLLFVLCWSFGEFVGYLTGEPERSRGAGDSRHPVRTP